MAEDKKARLEPVETRGGFRVTLLGVFLNLVLAGLKLTVGHFAHSRALVADGVHSLSDLVSDALVLVGLGMTRRPSDREHPYGHGKFESLCALAVAAILVIVAGGILVDGLRSIFREEQTVPGAWAIVIALLSLAGKEFLYRITASAAAEIGSDSLEANAWHHRSDALSSLAVLAGLVGSRLGLPILDPVAAALVALAVGYAAWVIGRQALDKLTDRSLEPEEVEQLRRLAGEVEGLRDIHEVRGRWMGSRLLLDLHALVPVEVTVSEGHRIGELLRRRLMAARPELAEVIVHIEPEDHGREFEPGPGSEEVKAKLRPLLEGVKELRGWQMNALHYHEDRISVDICLILPADFTLEQAQQVAGQAKAAIRKLKGIEPGHICFHD